MTPKRLYRNRNEKVIWGVAGGLAEYFGLNPLAVRIVFVLFLLCGGFSILLYPILALMMPRGK